MATYEVQLAIYDLSHGMARSLSMQFLGPQYAIDIIPHTAIIAYGKEYFFGGGIQATNPEAFRRSRGINPIETSTLGSTTVTQAQFEQWCQQVMRNGRYSPEAYDLLNRNCNNFSHDAALEGLRLPQGVPEWILGVPGRFLASPMGQMIRPMLEEMQVTGGMAAPFADSAPSVATPVVANVNPWADISVEEPQTAAAVQVTTPILDSYCRPLLSNDTKTANLCAKKLMLNSQSDEDKMALEQMGQILTSGAKPSPDAIDATGKAILHHLQAGDNITYALMLLRLIVLNPCAEGQGVRQCLDWIQQELAQGNVSAFLKSPASRSMAWCTLSNTAHEAPTESVMESAIGDIVPDLQPRVEVRQAAAAFLYNVALLGEKDDLVDLHVSLLCSCLDGIGMETDPTTRLRRLLVAARIVKPKNSSGVNEAAKNLVRDLGFIDEVRDLARQVGPSGDAEKVTKVAAEFLTLVES